MKKLHLFLVASAVAILLGSACYAQNVKVKIAPYYTQIENVSVDNRYVEFPLITYKEITYFPMTYDLCGMLNLSVGFDSDAGLFITKHYVDFEYDYVPNYFGGSAKNYYNAEYDAVIPEYPVYLNGIRINNTKEEYPLINFRNITYFPMTWRFAYEELNFNIDFSLEDYSFILTENDRPNMAYVYKADEKKLFLEDLREIYEEHINEDGSKGYRHLYNYYEYYELNLETELLSKLDSKQSGEKFEFDGSFGRMDAQELEITAKANGLYLGDTLVLACNTENISDIQASEYKTGNDNSLITLVVYTGQIVPPYTHHNEYIIERVGDTFTKLDWDIRNNFRGVFADDNGGFYVCSTGYSPYNMGRWTNSFSDVYYYKVGSGLASYAEKYSDIINSVEVIGKANGKLYVKAVWYNADKNMNGSYQFNIAPVNSGFYEIDLTSGEMTKLYSYIRGETFMAPNGAVYCSADYARIQRLVNIVTGKLIPVE